MKKPERSFTITNARQGLLAGRGLHQGRLDPLLRGDRALDAAVSERPAGRSDPLSRRYRGQEFFPERRAVVRPPMDPDRGDILAGYRARHRLLRAGERRSNRLHGQPRRDSDSYLVVARSASRAARLAAVRYRPQRLDDASCGDRRAGSRRGPARRGPAPLSQDLGPARTSRRGGTRAQIHLRAGADVLRDGFAAGREPYPGDRDDSPRPRLARAAGFISTTLQLGQGKTIAAPFAVRPVPGAPVSAPLKWNELREDLDPVAFNIKTMPKRMARLRRDPFIGALEDRQAIEPAIPRLERELREAGLSR